ncbi:MAG: tail fiber domain-containing protein [Chitinophagaceae bacterium]|nr:tail fiber domain-containing protein [Chitinophagaceae bacterium]
MKKILFLIALIPVLASAQYAPNGNSTQTSRLAVDNTLSLPSGCGVPAGVTTLRGGYTTRPAVYFDTCGKTLWIWSPQGTSWKPMSTADSTIWATVYKVKSDSAVLRGFINSLIADSVYQASQISQRVRYVDTSAMLAGYPRLIRFIDSLAAVQARLNTKLNAVDTSSLSTRINQKLNITDTSGKWVGYGWLSSLLSSISGKVAVGDTAAMLTPYAKKDGSNAAGNWPINASTANQATQWNGQQYGGVYSAGTITAMMVYQSGQWKYATDAAAIKTFLSLNNVSNVDATNASNITSGTLADARLSANVTLQGNTFNGANQLVKLDGSGKLPTSTIPSLAITETFTVGSQAAMLALSAQQGDVAIRTDQQKTYILAAEPASTLSNWVWMQFPDAENDPIYTASSWYSTTNNSANWNTAYSWGNHASAGYAVASRTITINGTTYDLTANRTWTVGDVRTDGSYSNPAWITSLAWSKLTGVPSTFAPSAHTHTYADLTGTVPTWNQNTTGNAATATNSTQWNSQIYTASQASTIDLIMVHESGGTWKYSTASAVQSFLGLGSNAYTSTAYLPITAGNSNRLTGVLYADYGSAVKSAYGDMYVARGSNFGYSNSYGVVMLGYTGTANESLAFGVDLSSNPSGLFTGNGSEYFWRETGSFKTPNAANNGYNTLFSWSNSTITFPNGVNFSSSVAASSFEAPIFYKSATGNSWLINQSGYANRGLYWDQSELGWHFYDNGSARVKLGIDGSVTGAGTFTAGSFSGAGTGLTGTASSLTAGAVSHLGGYVNNISSSIQSATVQSIIGQDVNNNIYRYNASALQTFLGLGTAAYVAANQNLNTSSNVTFANIDASLIRSTGDVIAYYSSDRRLKNNIKPITNALATVERIGGYSYDWNSKQDVYSGHDYGVLAQEIEIIMPEAVITRPNGYKAVKYERLIPLLIQAIKELKYELDKR